MKIFFFHLPPTSNHLHSLQVENCDCNSRLVVNEDYNGKFRLEKVSVEDISFFTNTHAFVYHTTSVCFYYEADRICYVC